MTDTASPQLMRLQPLRYAIMKMPGGFPISFEGGLVLYSLCFAKQAGTVLELGTSYGYSTLFLSYGAQKVITVEEDVRKKEQTLAHFAEFKRNNIDLTTCSAEEYLRHLSSERFDLVFMDAEKKEYVQYIRALLPYLNDGAVIVADDVIKWKDKVQHYLDFIDKDPQFTHTILEVGHGFSIASYHKKKNN